MATKAKSTNAPTKKASSTTRTKKPKVVEPVVEELEEELDELEEEDELVSAPVSVEITRVPETKGAEGRKRRAPLTKVEILASFNDIIDRNNELIALLKAEKVKGGSVLVKAQNKALRLLRSQVSRAVKRRVVSEGEASNTKSGFAKPVKISTEMSRFLGTKPSELKSRIDVTKAICEYIRKENLQNPGDKRIIVPDTKLTKLLKYDPKQVIYNKHGVPEPGLFYYRLQSLLRSHFIPNPTTAVSTR